jgi:hypothetical protein
MAKVPAPEPTLGKQKAKATTAPAPSKGGRPAYVATEKDRAMVQVMTAGGIEQLAIAGVLGISHVTLRKHFRHGIDTGMAEIAGKVVQSLITMALGQEETANRPAVAPNFNAAKWYTQARLGWSERVVVDDGKLADTPMRVIVELVGDAATPRIEQSAPRAGARLPDGIRKNVQLLG